MKTPVIEMPDHIIEHLKEIMLCHDENYNPGNIELFKKVFNKYDLKFIKDINRRCGLWLIKKDGWCKEDRYTTLIEKHEKRIVDRVKKRIAKIKGKSRVGQEVEFDEPKSGKRIKGNIINDNCPNDGNEFFLVKFHEPTADGSTIASIRKSDFYEKY